MSRTPPQGGVQEASEKDDQAISSGLSFYGGLYSMLLPGDKAPPLSLRDSLMRKLISAVWIPPAMTHSSWPQVTRVNPELCLWAQVLLHYNTLIQRQCSCCTYPAVSLMLHPSLPPPNYLNSYSRSCLPTKDFLFLFLNEIFYNTAFFLRDYQYPGFKSFFLLHLLLTVRSSC